MPIDPYGVSPGAAISSDLVAAVVMRPIGALVFGHVQFGVTGSLIIGSVPAVLVGSLLSSTVPDRYIRPVIAFVIFASGLKYVGVPTRMLGWVLCATLLAAATAWLAYARPWARLDTPAAPAAPRPEVVPDELERARL